jgi:hypothetical protein
VGDAVFVKAKDFGVENAQLIQGLRLQGDAIVIVLLYADRQ